MCVCVCVCVQLVDSTDNNKKVCERHVEMNSVILPVKFFFVLRYVNNRDVKEWNMIWSMMKEICQ